MSVINVLAAIPVDDFDAARSWDADLFGHPGDIPMVAGRVAVATDPSGNAVTVAQTVTS